MIKFRLRKMPRHNGWRNRRIGFILGPRVCDAWTNIKSHSFWIVMLKWCYGVQILYTDDGDPVHNPTREKDYIIKRKYVLTYKLVREMQ